MSSLSPLEKEILKYEKNGFKKEQKKTLKYGVRTYLRKDGLLVTHGVYFYYVEGDSTPDSLREGLKDYAKFDEENNFDSNDKGIFMVAGSVDEKLFRDLRKSLIRNEDARNRIKLLTVNEPKKKVIGKAPTKEKDMRRSFTQTQKYEILEQQEHKCAQCHKKLDLRATEFHHKKPWASGGKTITVNGRALCAICHKLISHEHRLKQVDR